MTMSKPKHKYRVTAEITISVSTDVEATSKAEAIKLARDQPMMSFCHQCSRGEPEIEWVTSGELDGIPRCLRAELDGST